MQVGLGPNIGLSSISIGGKYEGDTIFGLPLSTKKFYRTYLIFFQVA